MRDSLVRGGRSLHMWQEDPQTTRCRRIGKESLRLKVLGYCKKIKNLDDQPYLRGSVLLTITGKQKRTSESVRLLIKMINLKNFYVKANWPS